MFKKIKFNLYFFVSNYFRYFAKIKLSRWHPQIIVITGSNGKTTTLHLVESQLGSSACYSHFANSTFGIPFDILGLKRLSYSIFEWFYFFLKTPFLAWSKIPRENIYIVEADSDRPGEGKFLSEFLKPDIVLWLSSAKTHSQNYEKKVLDGTYKSIEEAVAYEYGYFLANTKTMAIINSDNILIKNQLSRTKAKIIEIKKINENYQVTQNGVSFEIENKTIKLPFLLPGESFYSIAATIKLMNYLGQKIDYNFSKFVLPPSRSSIFNGIKDITIIDSSYNANYFSVRTILEMVGEISGVKWLVLGDLIEQGGEEKMEHEKLVDLVKKGNFDRVILVGPRLREYAYPLLKNNNIKSYLYPKEALEDIESTIKGGEIILFKGARFLEGVIEHLLLDKSDVSNLCRQGDNWKKIRKKWSL